MSARLGHVSGVVPLCAPWPLYFFCQSDTGSFATVSVVLESAKAGSGWLLPPSPKMGWLLQRSPDAVYADFSSRVMTAGAGSITLSLSAYLLDKSSVLCARMNEHEEDLDDFLSNAIKASALTQNEEEPEEQLRLTKREKRIQKRDRRNREGSKNRKGYGYALHV